MRVSLRARAAKKAKKGEVVGVGRAWGRHREGKADFRWTIQVVASWDLIVRKIIFAAELPKRGG